MGLSGAQRRVQDLQDLQHLLHRWIETVQMGS